MRAATLVAPTMRVRLLCFLLLGGFCLLAVRAAHLTVIDSRGRGWGDRQILRTLLMPAPRGMIVDRNGVELAVTLQAPSVYAIPSEMEDLPSAARLLAEILDQDPASLTATLTRRTRFTFVKRWATRAQAKEIKALELAGVGIVHEPRRAYPAGALAGQLIGFTNIDGLGVRAIEQREDETLRGEPRKVRVERDARGRLLAVDPVLPNDFAGGDVKLTIDASFQAAAEAALARAIERTGADGGVVVTIEPASGDLLSLAEYPAVDPNVFRDLHFATTRSRAFLDAIEPGSTMKAFLVAGALDTGILLPRERIDTLGGRLRIPGKTITDHHAYGELLPEQILGVSSNVGAVLISQRLEPAQHFSLLRRFGFGLRTGSGFPQESAGIMRPADRWKPVDQATIAFGQGISVTPVQLAAATAALANRGVWRSPRLVAARRPAGGAWTASEPADERRAVGEAAAVATVEMMESVVSSWGTGRRAALRGLRVAGKTGTAQKFDSELGRYSKTDYYAWFIGIVPADDPQLAIVVVLDEPKGDRHGGGDTAAPLFAEVASAQLRHLGIATAPAPLRYRPFVADPHARPDRARAAERMLAETKPDLTSELPPSPNTATAGTTRQSASAHFVPDFRGATLDSARAMAELDSFTLELEGDRRGLAVEQHPDPGTVVTGHRPRVTLRFTLPRKEG